MLQIFHVDFLIVIIEMNIDMYGHENTDNFCSEEQFKKL